MDEQHEPIRGGRRRRPPAPRAHRSRGLGRRRAEGQRPGARATRSPSSSTAAPTSARSRPTSPTGPRAAGTAIAADELLRVPCDLDLGDAESRDEAEEAYVEQARTLRDALVAADTVLAIWQAPLADLAEGQVAITRSLDLGVRLPAHRLMPIALVAPDRHLTIAPVCGARTLAEGRPPMGIACAQQDVAHVYPLPDDPERCLEDFAQRAADHALRMAERLEHQEASVRRFMELSGGDEPPAPPA